MKSSLGMLRKLALLKNDSAKEKRDAQLSAPVDELAQASQDMQEMRNCYDSLLSAAAATTNSAYEFSESLREMGSCIVEKTSLNDDEESGKVLSMLGQVQFELQKLVDGYRSHIIQTITNPSESLLNELRTVEEMKRQCDEKRNVYEYMKAQQREKGRSKGGKGESLPQLTTAHNEYNDEATLCIFRLKSLKQGQSRSLLTQAARHHAAQLNFFRKGLRSLEAVEQHLRVVAARQHIDYQFSGLEYDDGEDGEEDGEQGYDANEGGELSFDYRQNKRGVEVVSATRNSMDLDQSDLSFPQASTVETVEANPEKNHGDLPSFSREPRSSYSAPISAEKSDPSERARQTQPSTQKLRTYVLPIPAGAKSSTPSRTSCSVPRTRPTNVHGGINNLWYSSPLEPRKHYKDSGDDNMSGPPTTSEAQSVLKESNSNNPSIRQPPPLAEGLSLPQLSTTLSTSDTKKVKRQAFSGPLTSKPMSTNPALSSSGSIASAELPQLVSGLLSRVPIPQPSSSPKISPNASPLASSPRINGLHELPRPPVSLANKPARFTGLVGYSAPLISRNEVSATNKTSLMTSNVASPLPTPPVSRSFSIPSSSQRATTFHVSKLLDFSQNPDKAEEVFSPPLTPISLTNIKPTSAISEVASQPGQIRGES